MLTEPTIEKLQAMRLDVMASTWRDQAGKSDVHKLAFDERFGMIVDAEHLHRENTRLAKALRDAKLRMSTACVEDIDYPSKRELDKAQVRQLATCRWVVEHQNILITGKTGTGKTYVACALAQQACRKGHRAIYRRAARLFSELTLARADGTYARVLARIGVIPTGVSWPWWQSAHAPRAISSVWKPPISIVLDREARTAPMQRRRANRGSVRTLRQSCESSPGAKFTSS
jgi:hypothetical protein